MDVVFRGSQYASSLRSRSGLERPAIEGDSPLGVIKLDAGCFQSITG